MSMKTTVAMVSALTLTAAGCGSSSDKDEAKELQAIQHRLTLQRFESCDALSQFIGDTALRQVRDSLERQEAQYTQWSANSDQGGRPSSAPEMAASADASGSGAGNAAPAAPSEHTTTNTQVDGVDEADFVKNDGTRIFALSGGKLYISRSWPAAELAVVSSTAIEGWPREMFLDGNRVVVLSTVHVPQLDPNVGSGSSGNSGASPSESMLGPDYIQSMGNVVKVTVFDVTDSAAPVVKSERFLPGQYNTSRRIDASMRLVVSDQVHWPRDLKWYLPYDETPVSPWAPGNPYRQSSTRRALIEKAMAENTAIVRARSIEDWFPTGWTKNADGTETKTPLDCTQFSRATAPTNLGLLTVATVSLDAPEALAHRASIVASSGNVYASAKNLYVATQHWWNWDMPVGETDWTYVHKFDITSPTEARYVASGGVEGSLLNAFSMDEDAAGFLRTATTISRRQPQTDENVRWWWPTETTNRVSVLGENAGALELVGKTAEVAKGERITSARFFGPRGYVVTFRQVDPLYTLDLSNPADPRIVGELKIPGFSSYIHPLGENHLLTIGTYVPENPAPGTWDRAVKLAIFDVSDMAAPRETFTQNVGSASSYSEAQWNHKAFNYFASKGLLAIPFVDYGSWANGTDVTGYWSSFTTELRVFGVSTETGFTSRGALSMRDLFVTNSYPSWSYTYSPAVQRSVMADDFVYAISDAGIRVANIATLGTPLATAVFPRDSGAEGGSK